MEKSGQFLLQPLNIGTVWRRVVSFCFGLLTLVLNGEEWSVFASTS
jgi:hypothetical protein